METVEEDELQLLKTKIAELEAKIEEMKIVIFVLQADFDNSRRRAKLRHGSGSKI